MTFNVCADSPPYWGALCIFRYHGMWQLKNTERTTTPSGAVSVTPGADHELKLVHRRINEDILRK